MINELEKMYIGYLMAWAIAVCSLLLIIKLFDKPKDKQTEEEQW